MSTGARPLPRSCQRPAGLTVPVGLARRPSEPAPTDAQAANPSGADRPGQASCQMEAGAALTRQRLLRPRQQHGRRPPAPSSAAALASAAATNRPCGAANRHNCRRPAAEYPARPGDPAGWESSAAGAPTPRLRARPDSAGRGTGSLAGLGRSRRGVCYCRLGLSAAEHAGKQPAGGGATQASAQIRKSLGCRDGRGSASECPPNWQLVCPSLTLEGISVLAVDRPKVSATFWPRQTDPAKPGAAPTGEPEAEE